VGPKPCSRKFFGCTFAQGRFFFFGGVAIKLLNDLRSLRLGGDGVSLEWRVEDRSLENLSKYKYFNTQRRI